MGHTNVAIQARHKAHYAARSHVAHSCITRCGQVPALVGNVGYLRQLSVVHAIAGVGAIGHTQDLVATIIQTRARQAHWSTGTGVDGHTTSSHCCGVACSIFGHRSCGRSGAGVTCRIGRSGACTVHHSGVTRCILRGDRGHVQVGVEREGHVCASRCSGVGCVGHTNVAIQARHKAHYAARSHVAHSCITRCGQVPALVGHLRHGIELATVHSIHGTWSHGTWSHVDNLIATIVQARAAQTNRITRHRCNHHPASTDVGLVACSICRCRSVAVHDSDSTCRRIGGCDRLNIQLRIQRVVNIGSTGCISRMRHNNIRVAIEVDLSTWRNVDRCGRRKAVAGYIPALVGNLRHGIQLAAIDGIHRAWSHGTRCNVNNLVATVVQTCAGQADCIASRRGNDYSAGSDCRLVTAGIGRCCAIAIQRCGASSDWVNGLDRLDFQIGVECVINIGTASGIRCVGNQHIAITVEVDLSTWGHIDGCSDGCAIAGDVPALIGHLRNSVQLAAIDSIHGARSHGTWSHVDNLVAAVIQTRVCQAHGITGCRCDHYTRCPNNSGITQSILGCCTAAIHFGGVTRRVSRLYRFNFQIGVDRVINISSTSRIGRVSNEDVGITIEVDLGTRRHINSCSNWITVAGNIPALVGDLGNCV